LSKESLAGPLIVASLMLAVSILGSGYFMSKSIDGATERLRELSVAVKEIPSAAPAAAPSRQAARAGRPDPNKRYTIAVAGAPTKGPKNAPVTIVEWSDFQ
jgi:protein-disulfide isomerase